MMSLRQIYQDLAAKYSTDDGSCFCDKGSAHSYIDYYEDHFRRRRKKVKLLEIGLLSGGSLMLWKNYFENYGLFGIDVALRWNQQFDFQTELESDPDVHIFHGVNSTQCHIPDEIQNIHFDFIIDDGNHEFWAQLVTFQVYWPLLAQGGIYFIEDLMGITEVEQFQNYIACRHPTAVTEHYKGLKKDRSDDQILAIRKNKE